MNILYPLALSLAISNTAYAAQSSYTHLNFSTDCKFTPAEEGPSSQGTCKIVGKPTLYLTDGDSRESISFGVQKPFESFIAFNNVNNVIEWRSDNHQPYAAIVRFFVSHPNFKTGYPDKKSQSQYLLIHSIANNASNTSCVIGLVNALANKNANQLARQIADKYTNSFNCLTDQPQYYGKDSVNPSKFSKYITKNSNQ